MITKKGILDFILVILVVALILFLYYCYTFMAGNSKQCLQDPINYFMANNPDAECSCTQDGITWPNTVKVEKGNDPYVKINLSKFDATS